MIYRWFGDRVTAAIRKQLGEAIAPALGVAEDHMRELIGTQGPPRSEPFKPPHMDTQRLHDSLYVEVEEAALAGRLGSTEEHAVHTEEGTVNMDPRPWFRPSLLETRDEIARRLAQ